MKGAAIQGDRERENPTTRRWAPLILVAMVAVYLGVSLSHLDRYGQTSDETLHWVRGRLAVLMVQESFEAGRPLSFAELRERVEGDPVTDMSHPLLFPLLHYGANQLTRALVPEGSVPDYAVRHVPLVFTFALGAVFFFLLTRRVFGSASALWACAFLLLYPRLLAHAQFNPKDTPLMTFAIGGVYFLLRAFERPSGGRLVAAALACAVAVNTKLEGLWLVPMAAGAFGLYRLEQAEHFGNWREWLLAAKSRLRPAALFFFAFCGFCLLLWPMLWADPGHVIAATGRFTSEFYRIPVLYLGRLYPANELPWHYAPLYLLMVTPLPLVLLAGFGGARVISHWRETPRFSYALLLLWLVLPVAVRTLPGVVRYNGIRHFFLAVPPLLMLAGVGTQGLFMALKRRWPSATGRYAAAGCALVLLTWRGGETRRFFPYTFAYVNEPTRWLAGNELGRTFFLDYWNSTFRQGVQWLNEHARPDSRICVPRFAYVARGYETRDDVEVSCVGRPDYLMLSTQEQFTCRSGKDLCSHLGNVYELAYTERVAGVPLLWIYERRERPASAVSSSR